VWTALTPRERQLLHLLTNGADNATIATSMTISLFTVQDHLKSIYAKSGARTRTELIAQATAGRRASPVDPRQSMDVRDR
jgi:DNA-binding NarL/FixJ family response regulator